MLSPDLIKERITLSEVIGQTVKLKKSGGVGRWIARCPFHDDATPSFTVDDNRGKFKCWTGCCHGDVIDFLAKSNGISTKEAFEQAKILSGLEDDFVTKDRRAAYEAQIKRQLSEKKAIQKWREELRALLISYCNCQWYIYRTAKLQLLDTWTAELTEISEIAYSEATRKELALETLEEMSDQELKGWKDTKKSWEGVKNPPFFLSGARLELAKKGMAF